MSHTTMRASFLLWWTLSKHRSEDGRFTTGQCLDALREILRLSALVNVRWLG
jgi:hypothetical protein